MLTFIELADGFVLANFLEGGYIGSIKDVKINDRFNLNGDQLRGFKNLGIGPRDSSTSDALGGEIYYVNRNELTFPLDYPMTLELGDLYLLILEQFIINHPLRQIFMMKINLEHLQVLVYPGFHHFGPVKFYLSKALLKENYDKKEIFRFSFGTTY